MCKKNGTKMMFRRGRLELW